MIKTFRGLLADGGQDQIRLSTIKGKVGYRIVKFKTVSSTPGTGDQEVVTKIYKESQTSVDALVNFTDSNLLGMSAVSHSASVSEPYSQEIIFDREIFNQDIYVTSSATAGSVAYNYYLELEVVPLDDAGAEYTTLKDMRQS